MKSHFEDILLLKPLLLLLLLLLIINIIIVTIIVVVVVVCNLPSYSLSLRLSATYKKSIIWIFCIFYNSVFTM